MKQFTDEHKKNMRESKKLYWETHPEARKHLSEIKKNYYATNNDALEILRGNGRKSSIPINFNELKEVVRWSNTINKRDLLKILGISEVSIYKWIKKGKFPASDQTNALNHKIQWSKKALTEWIAENEHK